ncbi:peptidase M23 [Caproiciproducens sp. NJN-50]|uniref:murein hydrolase activator EnvC family protein n=1 Tax=Acutalibacteraceae TaxID=3082771 RepID=UPI000FFE1622|nr:MULTISPECIES: M23 family metallopeptidase [Acutalibacteraceae]QAT48416.1 peptidase M23 [Caproiciproducens sp. NJN-50]
MSGNKAVRILAAVLAAFLLLFSVPAVQPAQASTLSDLQKKQSGLKQKKAQVDAQIKSLKNDETKKQQYKDALTSQINTVEEQIDNLNDQIAGLNSDIKEKESQIAQKQKEIDTDFDKLKERLYAIYLTGDASTMEIILNAKSVMDLADKTEILQAITQHDTELIDRLKEEMQSVSDQKTDIEKNRDAVAANKKEYDQKQTELTSYVNEANSALADIAADQSAAQAQSKALAKQEDEASKAIDAWYAEYYASKGGGTGGSGGYVSTGNFMWPVPSCTSITSGFGPRWGTVHKGIDISRSGIYGAQIVAADSGKVMQAGYGNYGTGYGGYGNVVAIDHGGGYSTLYGHMSRVAVSKGQQVTKGQTIGYVGSTGDSSGPHCHFEIRVNGVAKNPLNWFSK